MFLIHPVRLYMEDKNLFAAIPEAEVPAMIKQQFHVSFNTKKGHYRAQVKFMFDKTSGDMVYQDGANGTLLCIAPNGYETSSNTR